MFIPSVLIRARHSWWPLQHKRALVRCPCAFRLRRLAQTGVAEISRATLSSLWASQIALVVARCEVCYRSLCGAVLILIVKKILRRDLDKKVFDRELGQRFCHGGFYRDLVLRVFIEILWRDLAQRSLTEILLTELLYKLLPRSLQGILPRGILYGSCTERLSEVSYQDLAKRALIESLCRDLWNRSCQDTSYKKPVQRACQETSYIGILYGDIAYTDLWRSCLEVAYRDLAKGALCDSFYRDLIKISCQETSYRELYRDLAERPLIEICTEILPRGLLQRSCHETSYRELVQRSCQETSLTDLVQRPGEENRDLF